MAASPLRTRRGRSTRRACWAAQSMCTMASDDLQRGVVERLAGLLVHELGQPAHVPGQVRLPGEQPDPPPGPAEPGPPRRGLAGLGHGGIYLAAPVYGEGGQHFPGRRIHCLKHRLTSKASPAHPKLRWVRAASSLRPAVLRHVG